MPDKSDIFKKKLLYRASYRGTKEMDILMVGFVRSIIDKLDNDQLMQLNNFVNLDDETLLSFKKKESLINFEDKKTLDLIEKFRKFK